MQVTRPSSRNTRERGPSQAELGSSRQHPLVVPASVPGRAGPQTLLQAESRAVRKHLICVGVRAQPAGLSSLHLASTNDPTISHDMMDL